MVKLLHRNDPPAVSVQNPNGPAPFVICCEHAANAIPAALDNLGLSKNQMESHIAYDIGAGNVAKMLSKLLDAPAVFAGYSRLIIDLNRPLDDFTSIREISDQNVIFGNQNLSKSAIRTRQSTLFYPFHHALAQVISRKCQEKTGPILISVHSFTPQLYGKKRPWHIGLLAHQDRRLADKLLPKLRQAAPTLTIGDNEPYSGMDPYGYTIQTHATQNRLGNILFEIRQDTVADQAGCEKFANILATSIKRVQDDPSLYLYYSPPPAPITA